MEIPQEPVEIQTTAQDSPGPLLHITACVSFPHLRRHLGYREEKTLQRCRICPYETITNSNQSD